MKKDQQRAIKTGFEAIAQLEEAAKFAEMFKQERLAKTCQEVCEHIEKFIDWPNEPTEKQFEEWENTMNDLTDKMIGQMILAEGELGVKYDK